MFGNNTSIFSPYWQKVKVSLKDSKKWLKESKAPEILENLDEQTEDSGFVSQQIHPFHPVFSKKFSDFFFDNEFTAKAKLAQMFKERVWHNKMEDNNEPEVKVINKKLGIKRYRTNIIDNNTRDLHDYNDTAHKYYHYYVWSFHKFGPNDRTQEAYDAMVGHLSDTILYEMDEMRRNGKSKWDNRSADLVFKDEYYEEEWNPVTSDCI